MFHILSFIGSVGKFFIKPGRRETQGISLFAAAFTMKKIIIKKKQPKIWWWNTEKNRAEIKRQER